MNPSDRQDLGAHRFRFAIVADTHMNPRDGESPSPWLTNREANARARAVVLEVNRLRPAFTIHLGDIVHPVPSQSTYAEAAERARGVFERLEAPVHFVAGNHDMGDKHVDWMPAAMVNDDFLDAYEAHFGKDYYAFDHQDCRFVIINAQVLNSGLAREAQQWDWLETELREHAGLRIYLFSHYPPYIAEPGEIEHYDNIGEPARGRLLALMARHGVEAVFAGHVHNYFYDRLGGCDLYVLPAVSAVRHDYSEIFRTPPPDPEFGRDDNAKLGFFVVDVHEHGHVARLVRSYGATAGETDTDPSRTLRLSPVHSRLGADCPVGVDMRHSWAQTVEIAYQGAVDEFYRKKARNDYALAALWEMGLRRLRIPVDDLMDEEARRRVSVLRELGHEFLLFCYEVPTGAVAREIRAHRHLLGALEIIIPWRRLDAALRELAAFRGETGLPVYLSKLRSSAEANAVGARYTHFISHGFGEGEDAYLEELRQHPEMDGAIDGVVLRVAAGRSVPDRVADGAAWARHTDKRVLLHVTLADENPAHMANDELATANRVAAGLLAGHAHSAHCALYLDTLADMDRGYFPRIGLVDRRYNPRLPGRVLANLQGELAQYDLRGEIGKTAFGAGGCLLTGRGETHLVHLALPEAPGSLRELPLGIPPAGEARLVDLDSGEEIRGPWASLAESEPGNKLERPVLIVVEHT